MTIKVLLVDLRQHPIQLSAYNEAWQEGLTARQSIEAALGMKNCFQVIADLGGNFEGLIVSWANPVTGEHSEIGGVGSLDWEIPDNSILSLVYEGDSIGQDDVDLSIQWMLQEYKLNLFR